MATINEKMTALAEEIRELSGTSSVKTIDNMTSDVAEANGDIEQQIGIIDQIRVALAGKASGSGGIELPELTNPASSSDILSGKEAIDGVGAVITGTIPIKTSSDLTTSGATVTVPSGYYASQATKSISSGSAKTPATTITKNPTISVNSSGLITASVSGTQSITPTVSAGYVSSGTAGTITVSGSTTQQLTTQGAKTITPSTGAQTAVASGVYTTGAVTVSAVPTQTKSATPTSSAQTISPDSGKFLSSVTVNAIPSAYVQPTSTKGATTYTPSTSTQTIAAGTYCSGAQTIQGDTNLVAENIKKDVSIFGVSGTYEGSGGGSGGGGEDRIFQILSNTLTSFDDSTLTSVKNYAFHSSTALQTLRLVSITAVPAYMCYGCSGLTTVDLPNATGRMGNNCFTNCSKLVNVSIPKITNTVNYAFQGCTSLEKLDLSENFQSFAGGAALSGCSSLVALILRRTGKITSLGNANNLTNTPIANGTGYIYVPSALIETYKTATNWVNHAAQFRAIEDYPEICDPNYVPIISFTIDGVSYQAEEGMTWGEWVNSEYNTDGYYICEDLNQIKSPNTELDVQESLGGTYVTTIDSITSKDYVTSGSGVGDWDE